MPNKRRKYTAAEILSIFRIQHRLAAPLDPEADPTAVIRADMSVREWRWAMDLLPWRKLYPYLNAEFRIDLPATEWKAVLEPARWKKLWDVCCLIARHATLEIPGPVKLLGRECLSAGTFRTLKRNLQVKGVDVSRLRPSSKFGLYLARHYAPVLEEVTLTGLDPIDRIVQTRRKKGFWHAINIFDPDRYELSTGDVVTFRDLVGKMVRMSAIQNWALPADLESILEMEGYWEDDTFAPIRITVEAIEYQGKDLISYQAEFAPPDTGAEIDGDDWEAIFYLYLQETEPALVNGIRGDSESETCVLWTSDADVFRKMLARLVELLAKPEEVKRLRGRLD
ncbi:Imm51 family immunity protein [Flavilitoribacter nigricans]|uniref:Imm51 family immunity protein n=1 Tax=Flavilitoribacter nigricans TaxID=70997 RepID=UPI00162891EE|nr:Imm51 family immunity protein [Flavilitoribacter nigricans]